MSTVASSQARTDIRDSGVGAIAAGATPTVMQLILGLVAHIAQMLAAGRVRSFAHLCQLCLDIDRQVIRFLFAEAAKLDPAIAALDPEDYDLVWSPDGLDFDIVHWSEAQPIAPTERFAAIRLWVELQRIEAMVKVRLASRHASWRRRLRRLASAFAPATIAVAARAPP